MKLKLFIISVLCAFLTIQKSNAQVTDGETKLRTKSTDTLDGWKKGGVFGANLSQTSLTNWAAGGQNSFSVNGFFSVFANYKAKKAVWDNTLDMGYGTMQQGRKAPFLKTDDKIEANTKFGMAAFKNFYYAALGNFRTQMAPGYNYPNDSVKISNFLAPAYTIVALGLDYKPNNYISVFAAPLTGKITLVNNQDLADAGAFGVEKAIFDDAGLLLQHGKLSNKEFGGYIRMLYSKNDFKNEWLKNVSLTAKLDIFSNYLKEPQNMDINWETLLAFKVNKWIQVSINNQMRYDNDIDIAVDSDNDGIIDGFGPRLQIKNIIGVGFAYKF